MKNNKKNNLRNIRRGILRKYAQIKTQFEIHNFLNSAPKCDYYNGLEWLSKMGASKKNIRDYKKICQESMINKKSKAHTVWCAECGMIQSKNSKRTHTCQGCGSVYRLEKRSKGDIFQSLKHRKEDGRNFRYLSKELVFHNEALVQDEEGDASSTRSVSSGLDYYTPEMLETFSKITSGNYQKAIGILEKIKRGACGIKLLKEKYGLTDGEILTLSLFYILNFN